MAHSNSHPSHSDVPEELVAQHRSDWHRFTSWTVKLCVATAAVLVLMLVFLRIL